jgi:hypothetical protein
VGNHRLYPAADCLQRPLRFRFRRQLTPCVDVICMANDCACATRRNDVMGGKPYCLYRQAISRWAVASGGCKPEVK